MTLPADLKEYEQRFMEHVRTRREEGQSMLCIPCPFCAARDWFVVAVEEG